MKGMWFLLLWYVGLVAMGVSGFRIPAFIWMWPAVAFITCYIIRAVFILFEKLL